MNSITLTGNAGRDPESQTTQTGKMVAKFSLAVRGFGDKSIWVDIECWNKTAEIVMNYVQKGSKVGITGRHGS